MELKFSKCMIVREASKNTDEICIFISMHYRSKDFPGGSGKNRLQCGGPGLNPWGGTIPWRRAWLPTPVFLPGKSHGQRSLVGHSPWGRTELDSAERLSAARYIFEGNH